MRGDTKALEYAALLQLKQRVWWKRLLPVQAPYQWNLRRQRLGVTLEVGCGIGRNLRSLVAGSLGIDHNEGAVAHARHRGLNAMTVDAFLCSERGASASFDSLLFAHVLEHMTASEAEQLVASYLPYLRPGGRVFMICPQERGFRSDSTHEWFAQDADLGALCDRLGITPIKSYSFPLPRWAGRFFVYNETCVMGQTAVGHQRDIQKVRPSYPP